jgi:hypothetical protein
MAADETVFVVSAWNDNGHVGYAADETQALRGEHFMALGWMLSKRAYAQVSLPPASRRCLRSPRNRVLAWLYCQGEVRGETDGVRARVACSRP